MTESVFSVSAFHCPKEGNAQDDYEDAWSIQCPPDGHRIAIADGATESSFSKLWAALLVESFTRSRSVGYEFFWNLQPARRLWSRSVKLKDLPWYAKEKAGMGAFAAFLGVSVNSNARTWDAIAVGDCCLFHLDVGRRGYRLLTSFPLDKSESFGMSPFLLGTTEDKELHQHLRRTSGYFRPGDSLLLASDALSAWMLQRHEVDKDVWEMVSSINTQSRFEALVHLARTRGLHNDDSTLVRLTFHG